MSRVKIMWCVLGIVLSSFGGSGACSVLAENDISSLSYQEARRQDLDYWRGLLSVKKYAELEGIASQLRANPQKYSNGRGRDWRFYWIPIRKDRSKMTEEDYRVAFLEIEGWLEAIPDSIAARLMLAQLYQEYSFHGRGGAYASKTSDEKLQLFKERNEKAQQYLNEIAENPEDICNVHRRLQIEISKGLGKQPDKELVYQTLREDPLNMELVHGMSSCLLPRWGGGPGELEEFADECMQLTKKSCGAFQYLNVAMVTKEYLKEYVLLEHDFEIAKIQQGAADALRLYPNASEYHDQAAQFLYLSGDVEAASTELEQILTQPNPDSWKYAGINFDEFRHRVGPALLEGEQLRMIAGSATPIVQLNVNTDETVLTTIDAHGGIRFYDLPSGDASRWMVQKHLKPWTVSFHESRFMVGGVYNNNRAELYDWDSGNTIDIGTFKPVEATCFSPDGEQLAIADAQGVVTIHDTKTGELISRYPPGRLRHLTALAFSPEGDELVATTRYGKLLFINLQEEDDLQEMLELSPHGFRSLAWSKNQLAVGGWRGTVLVLDRESRKTVKHWTPAEEVQVRSLAFSPEGNRLAIGLSPHKQSNQRVPSPLLIWRLKSAPSPQFLDGHQFGVISLQFMNKGKTLVSTGNDWSIRFWDVRKRAFKGNTD